MPHYRFLLFDADYTLLDFDAELCVAFEDMYRSLKLDQLHPYTPDVLSRYEAINNAWWDRFNRGQCTKDELFLNRFRDFLQAMHLPGEPLSLHHAFFAALGKGGTPYPGAQALLHRLAQHHKVYIATNGNQQTQLQRIAHAGFLPDIEGVFVSEACGHGKPHPAFFDYAFARIPGFDKQRSLLIGDTLETDILGANQAGIDSLWYHPDPKPNPAQIPCTYEAASYADILSILEAP